MLQKPKAWMGLWKEFRGTKFTADYWTRPASQQHSAESPGLARCRRLGGSAGEKGCPVLTPCSHSLTGKEHDGLVRSKLAVPATENSNKDRKSVPCDTILGHHHFLHTLRSKTLRGKVWATKGARKAWLAFTGLFIPPKTTSWMYIQKHFSAWSLFLWPAVRQFTSWNTEKLSPYTSLS